MELIRAFLEDYGKKFNVYQEASRLCAKRCESALEQGGIRAIVSYRAKRPERLKDKVEERYASRPYRSVRAVYRDIRDLAGVRIALYFPADRDEVDRVIRNLFEVHDCKKSPFGGRPTPRYARRFPGYLATHYHVTMKKADLTDLEEPCARILIEIQVASVLMHAWAEVEHDLVYKAQYGSLSEDEMAILDELNGLILSGEIALERLQKSLKMRISENLKRFSSHYELAAYLYEVVKSAFPGMESEPRMGRADVLLAFLREAKLDRPGHLRKFVSQVDPSVQGETVIDQVIDRILLDNPRLYRVYARSRQKSGVRLGQNLPSVLSNVAGTESAAGHFMSRWITFEKVIREIYRERRLDHSRRIIVPTPVALARLGLFSKRTLSALESIRKIRNQLVHGFEVPGREGSLQEAGRYIEQILKRLCTEAPDRIRQMVDRGLDPKVEQYDFITL